MPLEFRNLEAVQQLSVCWSFFWRGVLDLGRGCARKGVAEREFDDFCATNRAAAGQDLTRMQKNAHPPTSEGSLYDPFIVQG